MFLQHCRGAFDKELAILIDVAAQCRQENMNENRDMNTIADHDLGFLMHLYRVGPTFRTRSPIHSRKAPTTLRKPLKKHHSSSLFLQSGKDSPP